MNKNMKTGFTIGIILLIVIPLGLLFFFQNKKSANEMNIVSDISMESRKPEVLKEEDKFFCTQDAKQCPDGSYVSRKGANCEFAACPKIAENKSYVQNEEICKKYSELIGKYGVVEYGFADINSYDKKSTGALCSVKARENTYDAGSFEELENKVITILKNEGWQDLGTGGDLAGIGGSVSTSIYKKDNAILLFERGFSRDNEKVQKCMSDNSESEFPNDDFLFECINKIEAEIHFMIMAGKESN